MKRITFLAASILFLMACNNEIETGLNFPEIPDNPDTRITLKLSDAQIFTYSTATASECYIDSLWVLRFQGNTLMESVLIPGDRIARNGQATQMLPQLPFELKNGDKIILLANTGVKTLPTGLTATNINEKFPMRMAQLDNISYYSEGESLPMYGEISNWGSTYDCEMIRAVAKIQVKLGETFTDLTGGSPSWPNDIYYQFNFLPPGGDIQPANTVAYHTLSLGYSTPPNVDFRLLQDDAHPSDPKAVYVYEFRSSTQVVWNASSVLDTDFDPGRPHLMLVDAANQAFWRLDFYDSHPSRKRFIDIKRNCHYIFTINRVSSPGYTNPGNATQNPGSNIEYTVKVDGAYDHITSNGQYAIATSVDSAFVRADTANAAIAKVRYILGTGMSSLGTAVDTVMTTTGSGLTVNSPIKLKPTPSSADVVVTTTGSFQEDSIIFRLGNIVHKLYVKAK